MQKTIKRQRIFIAILLILSLIICVLSYKLQLKAIAIEKENKELREIVEIGGKINESFYSSGHNRQYK